VREAPTGDPAKPFALSERYTDAPSHIRNRGTDFEITIQFSEAGAEVRPGFDSAADMTVIADYQAILPLACYVVGIHEGGLAAFQAMLETLVMNGEAQLSGESPAYLAPLHDRIASRSRPNP